MYIHRSIVPSDRSHKVPYTPHHANASQHRSSTIINLPRHAQARPIRIDQEPRTIEKPRILLHHRTPVQKSLHRSQKGFDLRFCPARRPQLRHPQRPPPCRRIRRANIPFESAGIAGVAIPMYRHEVDVASRTLLYKFGQIRQTHLAPAVRHPGGTKAHFPSERVYPGLVPAHRSAEVHAAAAAAAAVGLVEGENGGGAVGGDGGGDVGGPEGGQVGGGGPEHGGEGEGGVVARPGLADGVGVGVPVVGPGDFGGLAGEGVRKGEVGVVVGEVAFAGVFDGGGGG